MIPYVLGDGLIGGAIQIEIDEVIDQRHFGEKLEMVLEEERRVICRCLSCEAEPLRQYLYRIEKGYRINIIYF